MRRSNPSKWMVRIAKANKALERPIYKLMAIGLMLLIVAVYFAWSNAQFQKDNDILLRDTHAAAKNSERIIQDLERAVDDLKADNAQQTVILCRLILGGTVEVDDTEAAEVERICHERVNLNDQRQVDGTSSAGPRAASAAPTSPTSSSSPPEQGGGTAGDPDSGTPDNEGVIIDLPLLPRINVPSPL